MGASLLRKKVKQADLNISVTNTAISNIPSDAQIVITQEELTPRAQNKVPDAYHISVDNFLSSPEYDKLIDQLKMIILLLRRKKKRMYLQKTIQIVMMVY